MWNPFNGDRRVEPALASNFLLALLLAIAVPELARAESESVAAYQPSWIGRTMVVRGTVSRFVQRDVKGEPYVYLYFRERPDSTVVACSRDDRWLLNVLDIDDFQSAVGKALEFSGEVVKGTCTEQGAGLWIWQRGQARIVAGTAPASASTSKSKAGGGATAALSPTLEWHPQKERPNTVLKSDVKLIGRKTAPHGYDGLFAEAVCAKNGMSVNFQLTGDPQPGPQFERHVEADGEGFVDVDVNIDGKSHTAKGFLRIQARNQFVNQMGVLFYRPGIAAREPSERRLETRTGTALDRIIGPLVTAATEAEIDEGIRTSAGSLTDLVNARSIRLEVPVHEGSYKAPLELKPQEATLHAFATRCLTSTDR